VKREIIITADGSQSISVPEMNVTYHSIHGAIQESKHVFIEAGLHDPILPKEQLSIFEVGFGTGLNALLTMIEAEKLAKEIYYEAVEQFPLDHNEIRLLNYCGQLGREDLQSAFEQLHDCNWENEVKLTRNFSFRKSKINLLNLPVWPYSAAASAKAQPAGFGTFQTFNLIYFDAFAPNVQPELWTNEIFQKIFSMLDPGGVLVTYCSQGDVRRAMQAAGFLVEKLPGPKGKREIIRATRQS